MHAIYACAWDKKSVTGTLKLIRKEYNIDWRARERERERERERNNKCQQRENKLADRLYYLFMQGYDVGDEGIPLFTYGGEGERRGGGVVEVREGGEDSERESNN